MGLNIIDKYLKVNAKGICIGSRKVKYQQLSNLCTNYTLVHLSHTHQQKMIINNKISMNDFYMLKVLHLLPYFW